MKKLMCAVLAVVCLFTLAFSVACGKKEEQSYWQVTKLAASDNSADVMTQYLQVSLKDTNMKEFWINISGLSVSEAEIGYVFGTSSTLKKEKITKQFLEDSNGWVKITASGSSKTFKITFTEEMRVNEIVFVNEKDKVMEFDFTSYAIRPSFTSTQVYTFTKENLETITKGEKEGNEDLFTQAEYFHVSADHNALCAFDEQEAFNLTTANDAYKHAKEAEEARSGSQSDTSSSK